jgi:hypothetical protein
MSEIPRTRCTAKKRSGEPCKLSAIAGGKVCRCHGGQLPVVQRAAAQRVALYEALDVGEHRPVWQVLLDTVHAADVVMRDLRATLGEDGAVTPEQLDRFVQAVERAGRMAKTAIDARVAEMQVRDLHQQAAALTPLLSPLLELLEEYAPEKVVLDARAELAARLTELDRTGWRPDGLKPAIQGYVVSAEGAG